ncbi:MAG: RNA polymerase factor sigma-54 [Myxococcales bacterium]|nr:RNA polymerase factor sigma-54 [Myxococcales bacterium]
MELRQSISQKMTQRLVITPQLQQAIKLLPLSTLELAEYVQEQLLENPILESASEYDAPTQATQEAASEGTQPSSAPSESTQNNTEASSSDNQWEQFVDNYEEFSNENYAPSYRLTDDEMPSLESTLSTHDSLPDHLMWQLQLSGMDPEDEELGARIIGNIDDDGYFNGDLLPALAEECRVPLEEAEWVLERIQRFDPIGVAARNLRECLQLQVEYYFPDDDVLQDLVNNHLDNVEKRNYPAICKALGVDMAELSTMLKQLATLEPKPGRSYTSEEAVHITPDVHVHRVGDRFEVTLNEDGLPKLRISSYYKDALRQSKGDGDTRGFIQDKFKSAVWLIRSIHQRQNTIRRVTESIVKFQREFLEKGVEYLKPLILREVADDIGVHESTVSRVTTNKYVHTPQGIFELKYFFNSRIPAVGTGNDHSSESVKQMLKKLVDAETPSKPLSDAKIVKLLKGRGVDIARRTVAKYREALNIPPSSQRKRLF